MWVVCFYNSVSLIFQKDSETLWGKSLVQAEAAIRSVEEGELSPWAFLYTSMDFSASVSVHTITYKEV